MGMRWGGKNHHFWPQARGSLYTLMDTLVHSGIDWIILQHFHFKNLEVPIGNDLNKYFGIIWSVIGEYVKSN